MSRRGRPRKEIDFKGIPKTSEEESLVAAPVEKKPVGSFKQKSPPAVVSQENVPVTKPIKVRGKSSISRKEAVSSPPSNDVVDSSIDIFATYTLEQIKNHAYVVRINSILEDARFDIKENLLNDILTYTVVDVLGEGGISVSSIPTMFETPADLDMLYPYFLTIQGYKDRLVRIIIPYTLKKSQLAELQDKAFTWAFRFKAISGLKTIDQRKNTAASVFGNLTTRIKEIKTILSAAELARDNLRDTHFALKELTAAVVASVEYKAFLEKVTMDHNEL